MKGPLIDRPMLRAIQLLELLEALSLHRTINSATAPANNIAQWFATIKLLSVLQSTGS